MKTTLQSFFSPLALGLSAIVGIASCAFPFQSSQDAGLQDISGQLGFNEISRQGFMGGSVLYNPDEPSSGQLTVGAHVAVRLGRVEQDAINSDYSLFTDKTDMARYGYLTVSSIDKNLIAFGYTEYAADGVTKQSSTHTVRLNEATDINGDGLDDVAYVKPKHKRPGMEEAVYLTFLSSQETLNTAMFAVLSAQYSRSVYPSGIIGINPDGRFIVSKYEGATTNRAAVKGVERGDFVLDANAGTYQRLVNVSASRNARAISDSELEDVEQSGGINSYLFTEAEFTNGYNTETLFSALPEAVKTQPFLQEGDFVQKLNMLLVDRNLIGQVSQYHEMPVSDAILAETIAQVVTLSEDEVTQVNRIFMEEMYPEFCPSFFNPTEGFIQVIPLASIIIGSDDTVDSYVADDSLANRAATASEYDTQKQSIDKNFGKFKEIFSKPISISRSTPSVTTAGSCFKIGIKGSFNNTWGNINSSIGAAIYISANVNVSSSQKFTEKDLLPLSARYSYPVFAYGPIILNVTLGFGFNLPLAITAPNNVQVSVTGMYGVGAEVGLNYGVTTKKVWIIRIPVPYCDAYTSASKINNTAYYIGAASSTIANVASITLNPTIRGSIGANISGVIGADLVLENGLKNSLGVAFASPYLTGTAKISRTTKLYVEPWIGVDIPFLGRKSWSWPINVMTPQEVTLAQWQLFKKAVY
jgi:hypothetical protein